MKKKPIIAVFLSLIFATIGASVVSARVENFASSSLDKTYTESKYSSKETARTISINTENNYEILSKDYFHIEWAKFTIPEDGIVTLTLNKIRDELPIWIRIENENGTAKFLDKDTAGDKSYIDNSYRSYGLELKAGTYYLCLNNASKISSDVIVNYKLKYDKTSNNKTEVTENENKWITEDGKKYFYHNGKKAIGLGKIENDVYLFDESGVMQTGWQKVEGFWKYFNGDGTMKTEWLSLNGSWYYLDRHGDMATDLFSIDGVCYLFDANGVMQTGWIKHGTWRYFDSSSGAMHIGWLNQNGKWYYMNGSGDMVTGYNFINYVWYYFNSDGTYAYRL